MKKTVKLIAILAAVVLTAAVFAACNDKPAPVDPSAAPDVTDAPAKDYDVTAVAQAIAENVPFEDEYLAYIDDRDFALTSLGVDAALVAEKDGAKEVASYVSGAYPEMIIAIHAVDETAAASVMEVLEARISNYITNYSTYTPEQVAKLESAVTATRGNYVFVIVSNDNIAARSFLDGQLG